MTTTYVATFSIAFCLATSVLVHTALYHGKSILQKLKNVRTETEDVHAKLMRNYPEVPDWWYWAFLGFFALLGIIANEVHRAPSGPIASLSGARRSGTRACRSGPCCSAFLSPRFTYFPAASSSR
jgi:hypothetical protein